LDSNGFPAGNRIAIGKQVGRSLLGLYLFALNASTYSIMNQIIGVSYYISTLFRPMTYVV